MNKLFVAPLLISIGTAFLARGFVPPQPRYVPLESTATPDNALPKSVTWNRHIAPIVFENCAPCHRSGEVAPFSLSSYEDARKRAKQIALVTESRFMPPWKADEHPHGFDDEKRLSDREIALIAQWAESGAPRGKAPAPMAPKFSNDWQLGQPDAVLDIGEDYTIPAEGEDIYRCFVLPADNEKDRFIAAMEVRPGNRRVVHHVIGFLDSQGAARKLDAAGAGPGYTSFGGVGFMPNGTIGGWAPGNEARRTPPGTGILIPKGAEIVLQVHYHPSGKAETDRTKIALYDARGPIDKRVRVAALMQPFLRIPAHEANHLARAEQHVMADVTALSVTPHMHLLGREMKVWALLPDKTEQPLVRVGDWDFNWQTTYVWRRPLQLPKGTRVRLEARYDNSSANPRNPANPPRSVTWGEETTDEMCIAFFSYTVDAEHLTQGQSVPPLPGEFGARRRRRASSE